MATPRQLPLYEGAWQGVALLSPSASVEDLRVFDYSQPYSPTSLLHQCPAHAEILHTLKTTIFSARLLKLAKFSRIQEHTDPGTGFDDGVIRLHIPIQTDERIYIISDGQKVHFAAGGCYYLDASKPHSVFNPTDVDRIHLVVDCQRNTWLETFFLQAGIPLNASNPSQGGWVPS